MADYKQTTIFIPITKEQLEQLMMVRQLDRVIFDCAETHECFEVYNLVSDN